MAEHECVFVEEQEPNGRLILPPCIVCGLSAMDALDEVRQRAADAMDDLTLTQQDLAGERWHAAYYLRERNEAREAHDRLVRLIQRSTGVADLGLICECGHMHIADETDEDAGCRVCECTTFARASLVVDAQA